MKTLYSHLTLLSFILLYSVGTIQGMEPERTLRKLPPIPTQSPTTNQPSTPNIITIELNDIEDDLVNSEWIEVVNAIVPKLQKLYHPNINAQSIEQFKKTMLNQDEHSIATLNDAIKNSFGVGHLYTIRDKADWNQINREIPSNSKITSHFRADRQNDRKRISHHYDPAQVDIKTLKDYLDTKNKISLKIFKDIPIITVPSFNFFDPNGFLESLTKMTNILQRNYDYIILDLRGNQGGDIGIAYYFLSLFLGNNDPDIYPINLDHNQKLSYEDLNKQLSNKKFPPFYQWAAFDSVNVTKNTAENITFKKMVILVDEHTFSSGELVAATLKNTLGSKVCILGKPCAGSFEQSNTTSVPLPHEFKLYLSNENMVFYSKKLAKLITGCRLLPDIRHDDMSTIGKKALEILSNEIPCSANTSYERTVK